MKKLNFKVTASGGRGVEHICKENNETWKSQGRSFVILELEQPTRIKSLIVRNSNSAFIRILVGDRVTPRSKELSDDYKVLVPLTQMNSAELNHKGEKINRVKTFRKFSPFVCNSSSLHRVVVVECVPFFDSQDQFVGLSWIQVFGDNGMSTGSENQSDSSQSQTWSPQVQHAHSHSPSLSQSDEIKTEESKMSDESYSSSSPIHVFSSISSSSSPTTTKTTSVSPTPSSPTQFDSVTSSEVVKKPKPFVPPTPPSDAPRVSLFSSQSDDQSKVPLCSGHQMACVSRQWRLQDGNNGRMYYVCTAKPACAFKQWEDGTPFKSGPVASTSSQSLLSSIPDLGVPSDMLSERPSSKRKLS